MYKVIIFPLLINNKVIMWLFDYYIFYYLFNIISAVWLLMTGIGDFTGNSEENISPWA